MFRGKTRCVAQGVDRGSMENYRILGRIGEGAHGVVLKAKHTQVKSYIHLHNHDK